LRRLRILIEHLPPNGARARALKGHAWTDDTYLLAIAADRIGESAAGIVRALGGKASRPKALPRPGKNGNRTGNRGAASTHDVISYLEALKPA
jgi:hypothetical protein